MMAQSEWPAPRMTVVSWYVARPVLFPGLPPGSYCSIRDWWTPNPDINAVCYQTFDNATSLIMVLVHVSVCIVFEGLFARSALWWKELQDLSQTSTIGRGAQVCLPRGESASCVPAKHFSKRE